MKLRAVRLFNVRQFGGRGVAIEGIADGLNSFAEPNETGKSTIFDALQELLFKKHTSKDTSIRGLQPYAGGNPHISADVEVEGRVYRIEKRFLGGPALARVVDLSTGQEVARQDAVQDWLNTTLALGEQGAGPAGLLWVRQGDSWSQAGGAAARGGALAAIVAEQLDAVTAGARMRSMMDRTAAELAPLVTAKGQPKANGPFAEAISAVDVLEVEERDLSERFAALKRDLEDRRRLQRDLAALTSDADAIREHAARLAKAEGEEAKAATEAARLPELQRRATAATSVCKMAERELEQFIEARSAAKAEQEKIASLSGRLPELAAAAEKTKTALQTAGRQKSSASEAALQAETAWTKTLAAKERKARERHLAELRVTETKALAAAKAAREARAAASLIAITRGDLERIEAAARDLDQRKLQAQASATSIEMAYFDGREGAVTVEGDALREGARVEVLAQTAVRIDGVGVITVRPGGEGRAASAAGITDAAAALSDQLSKAGQESLDAAREALRRKDALAQEAKNNQGILDTLAPQGIEALSADVAKLAAEVEVLAADGGADPEAVKVAFDDTKQALRAAETGVGLAEQTHSDAEAALRTANGDLEEAKRRLSLHLDRCGPEATWESRSSELSARVGAAATDVAEIGERLAELDGAVQRHEFAKAEVKRLRQEQDNRSQRVHQIELKLAGVEQRFQNATDEGLAEALQGVRGALEAARRKQAGVEKRVRALQLLDQALKSAHRAMREVYFEPVNAELRPLLKKVLRGDAVIFDDDNFEADRLSRDGLEEDVSRLSGGTQEQIAILTRLAFAKLLARGGRSAPVILDDALIFTDDDRIEDMFTILNTLTDDVQIIVLTCRQRAFQSMGGSILSLSDWRPDDD